MSCLGAPAIQSGMLRRSGLFYLPTGSPEGEGNERWLRRGIVRRGTGGDGRIVSKMEDSNNSVISKWYNDLHAKYRHQWKSYETWVTENPESVARVEGIFRSLAYVSYMFTGQEITQQVLPELVYALSNLYVFFNDNILRKALHLCRQMTLTEERLIKLLTVIEHIEVFLELAGTRLAGRTGRWIIIASVHILRVILRLVLLFKYGSGIQPVPPLSTLKRDPKSLTQSHLNEPQSLTYMRKVQTPHSQVKGQGELFVL
ncbi:putative peroxisomal membrane protein PEX16 [Apostichopus japonicus]|uniref:Peroxisomal membrane protein PEX16 n=1 Tax=Stichopus japonicus TaxID=307972 RepID=A0A2G8L071_STIJA|nr:putative peroxisomal membrane protein PEX16 [Apostichopus japonicus]